MVHCWAGCSQSEVINALQQRGLWPKKKHTANVQPLVTLPEMRALMGAVEYNLKRNIPNTTKHMQLYRHYLRAVYSPFSVGEMIEMHLFCLAFKHDVRAGIPVTEVDEKKFMSFSKIIDKKGLPHVDAY